MDVPQTLDAFDNILFPYWFFPLNNLLSSCSDGKNYFIGEPIYNTLNIRNVFILYEEMIINYDRQGITLTLFVKLYICLFVHTDCKLRLEDQG